VWAGGYVVLPLLVIYEPIWKSNVSTCGANLGSHLVFGTPTVAALCVLARKAAR